MSEVVEVQHRVAMYIRVSTEEQAEKFGPQAQRSAIEGIIKSRGTLKDGRQAFVFAGEKYIYQDEISGTTKLTERPRFAKLMEDLEDSYSGQKPFDIVAVYRIDRFARRLKILINTIDYFKEQDIDFVSATESIDTTTPFGRAMLGIMGVISELELETIKSRMESGRKQAFATGKFMGSFPPLGYIRDKEGKLEIMPEEAEIIEKVFNLFVVKRLNPHTIAAQLTTEEVLSPESLSIKSGKKKRPKKTNPLNFWRAESVRKILSTEIYTGVYYTNKTKGKVKLPKKDWSLSPVLHEAIIGKPLFELAQQRLEDLSKHREITEKKKQNTVYLLSGLLRCDCCRTIDDPNNTDLFSWTGDRKKLSAKPLRYSFYYRCNHKNLSKYATICPTLPIPAEPLEKYIMNFIKELLDDPQAVFEYQNSLKSNELNQANIKSMKNSIKHLRDLYNSLPKRRHNLSVQHEMGTIDLPTFQARVTELGGKEEEYLSKIDATEHKLSGQMLSEAHLYSIAEYAKRYKEMMNSTVEDKNELYELIHGLIDQIIVYSRPRQSSDVVAGRKKEGQMIPNRIDIYLNLPQKLLHHLYSMKFRVKSDYWSG